MFKLWYVKISIRCVLGPLHIFLVCSIYMLATIPWHICCILSLRFLLILESLLLNSGNFETDKFWLLILSYFQMTYFSIFMSTFNDDDDDNNNNNNNNNKYPGFNIVQYNIIIDVCITPIFPVFFFTSWTDHLFSVSDVFYQC